MTELSNDQAIRLLRSRYEQAVASGNQAEANRLYSTIACYSPAVQPPCPRCRRTSLCRCLSSAVEPKAEGVIVVSGA